MSDATESPLPEPLPRRLGDPLRWYYVLVAWVSIPLLWISLGLRLLLPVMLDRTRDDAIDSTLFAINFLLVLCVGVVLPRRRANAIFLRSFRNDENTAGLRAVLQDALGRKFRLAGIRDPRRRWGFLTRHLLYILFIFRYASPRYMDLEAGLDWKQRLWRTLGESRCAVIDVTTMTPFVHEEIELAVQCLGLHRMMFIVDDSRSLEAWQTTVLREANLPAVPWRKLKLVVWSGQAGAARLASDVRAFAKELPEEPPGLNPAAFPDRSTGPEEEVRWAWHWSVWLSILVANLIGLGVAGLAVATELLAPGLQTLWLLPVLLIDSLSFLFLGRYLIECRSWRMRRRVVTWALIAALLAGGRAWSDWFTPQEGMINVVARMRSGNNLRQLGMAMFSYQDVMQELPPPAVLSPEGKPLLSWRVLILPWLDQESLYREFHLNEPWDSPHNIQLLKYMPQIYQSPYYPPSGDGTTTHYQMIVGPGTPHGRPRLTTNMLDDPGQTILLIEAAEAVPWTKPEDVQYVPSSAGGDLRQLVNRLGITQIGSTRRGIPAVMFDGHAQTLPPRSRLSTAELEAWIVGQGEHPEPEEDANEPPLFREIREKTGRPKQGRREASKQ